MSRPRCNVVRCGWYIFISCSHLVLSSIGFSPHLCILFVFSFEPMEHARTNLSVSKNMNFMWLRRLIGDYVGIPVLFLYNECNLVSLNKSVTRLEERISKHFVGTTPNYEIGLCCHSLGGPVAYRFLQKNRNRKIR